MFISLKFQKDFQHNPELIGNSEGNSSCRSKFEGEKTSANVKNSSKYYELKQIFAVDFQAYLIFAPFLRAHAVFVPPTPQPAIINTKEAVESKDNNSNTSFTPTSRFYSKKKRFQQVIPFLNHTVIIYSGQLFSMT